MVPNRWAMLDSVSPGRDGVGAGAVGGAVPVDRHEAEPLPDVDPLAGEPVGVDELPLGMPYRAAMPLMVSPARTTWVVAPPAGGRTAGARRRAAAGRDSAPGRCG